MQSSNSIITAILDNINSDYDFSSACEAVRAYEKIALPLPLRKPVLSVSCAENKVSFSSDKTENDLIIRLTCYTPLKNMPNTGNSLTENIFPYLKSYFGEAIVSYVLGETTYDDETKAYKMITLLHLKYIE